MKKTSEIANKLLGLLLFLLILFSACGGANTGKGDTQEYREMVEEIKDLKFEIENMWANPMQYSRVDLFGNPNYVRFMEDSVEVFLPFFGERYAGGGYDTDEGAIQYSGVPQNLKIEENPEKGAIKVFFEGNRKTENFDFLITIFSNGVTRTSVTSTQRENIIYDGKIIDK